MDTSTGTTTGGLWRALASPVVSRTIGEKVFDFYAGMLSPRLTARRVIARVDAVRDENRAVKSFVLRPNGHFRRFRAGQHVNLTVEIDGVRHTRSYSPSNSPGDGRVVLTVQRHPGGLVSRWLHEHVAAGDHVELGQPFGHFTLPAETNGKLLFIAGGSGITPVASLLRELRARGQARDVVVLGYGRTYADLIFAEELRAMAHGAPGARVHFAVTREPPLRGDLGGRFSAAHVEEVAPDLLGRQTFVCGPAGLVEGVRAVWAARGGSSLLKTESFSPLETLPVGPESSSAVQVVARQSGRSFPALTGRPLLLEAERAGLSPASGCRRGICFTCTRRKRSGVVRDLTTGVVSAEPDEDIRLCISVPLSDITLDL